MTQVIPGNILSPGYRFHSPAALVPDNMYSSLCGYWITSCPLARLIRSSGRVGQVHFLLHTMLGARNRKNAMKTQWKVHGKEVDTGLGHCQSSASAQLAASTRTGPGRKGTGGKGFLKELVG